MLAGHLGADLGHELLGLGIAGPGGEHLVQNFQRVEALALAVEIEGLLELLIGVLLARLGLDLGDRRRKPGVSRV